MSVYYVRTGGDDGGSGHDGTTPALAWLTLGYAMTHVAAGDTIYVGAGTYRISSTIAPSSMASMTYLYGDTDGSKTGDAGEVVVSTYSTSDTTAASAVAAFTFASKNYWTVGRLTIVSGSTSATPAGQGISITGGSHDLTFQDLAFDTRNQCIATSALTFGVTMNLTIERCRFVAAHHNIDLVVPQSATGAQTNAVIVIRNCVFVSAIYPVIVNSSSNATYKTGGVTIANCLFLTNYGPYTYQGYESTTYPMLVYNCLIHCPAQGLLAAAANQITEDYNVIVSNVPRPAEVSAGANSISNGSRMARFSLGHEAQYGGIVRALGEFPSGSPLLTWGGSSATGVPTDDINGVARPASGAASLSKSLGPYERSNSATREVTTVRSGTSAIRLAGPGYQDFSLPVDSVPTEIGVYGQFDDNYGAGTKPTMSVLNGGECGVASAMATMTVSANDWELLTLSFTPTAVGVVTIRLASLGSAAAGYTFFDDFSVA